MSEIDKCKIGARFVCDDHYGTIKYVGPVPPTDGIWLGVEWDDSSRGKHNGTHDGIIYFKTRNPKSGSFIRFKKVDLGISFIEAIQLRYNANKQNVQNDSAAADDLCIITKNNSVLPVEAVGYEKIGRKQSQLNNLTVVGLSWMKVSNPGSSVDIFYTTPKIRELDLSNNLLSNWNDVADIAQQLHCLKILDLSCNKLVLPSTELDHASRFESLEELILNKMDYNWQQIFYCSRLWPNIKKLQASFNNITSLEVSYDERLQNLEYLSLGHNPVTSWFEILKLGNLPKLKSLNLEDVGISDIVFEDTPYDGKTSSFPNLEIIYLQGNFIGKWTSINELNKLQSLKRISIQGNPIWDLDKFDNVWEILVAKLTNLQNLNGSSICAEERKGAELDYIKRHAKEWLAIKNEPEAVERGALQAFMYQHPRYCRLIEIYGPPDDSEVNIQRSVLKNNLIKLQIVCPQLSHFKPLTKSLPDSMIVEKLLLLARRLVKQSDIILTSISNKNPNHKIPLDNEQRLLSFYVEDGDQILVTWD